MEVQTEAYRAAKEGTLERHFSDIVAVIPEQLTMKKLQKRLENVAASVDELKIVVSDETSMIVELYFDEQMIPYEFQFQEARDVEECKMYYRQDHTITDEIFEDAKGGTEILVRTLFAGDVLSCFHHQLQVLWQLAPDLLFVIDESAAMKVISRKYVQYHVEDEILPDIPDLYTIHSIYEDGKDGEPTQYWFHTHGLLRAGVTEVELIIPNRLSSYYGIPDLFQTFANNAIENGHVPINDPVIIAQTQEGIIHTVAVPWEEGLSYIGRQTKLSQLRSIEEEEVRIQLLDANESFLGGMSERDENHQLPSVLLFYFDEENEKMECFFNDQKENKEFMFYKTNEETDRMAYNALASFGYFFNLFNIEQENEDFRFLAKFGIPYEEDQAEHMWFEITDLAGDLPKGTLINQPYYIEKMSQGDSYDLHIEHLTDWIIYAGDTVIKPNNLYLFS